MDGFSTQLKWTCIFLLYGSLAGDSNVAVKPCNGVSGTCQNENTQCKGSYLQQFDDKCPDNERFCTNIHQIQSTKECDTKGLPIVKRDSWGARTSLKTLNDLDSDLSFFVIHHADGYSCSDQKTCLQRMKEVQKDHQSKRKEKGKSYFGVPISFSGFDDIGYQYVIGGDGTVFEGRGWKYQGAHSPGYNTKSIGVCLLGNFTATLPSNDAATSLKNLHVCLQSINVLSPNNSVYGHRDIRQTECPGTEFYKTLKTQFAPFWHSIEPEMWKG
ncbi:peptidoglycan-recognition protein SC2-like [Ylistrum balloti]|uniref:peptidoglycan-recognition protein SC2-like n=1 Tax=Ylistrum balloti TaxID=509963 RepID=UPI002905C168|nr:peptidoglycan-recognition protein SC2-like [Ylistrum balloti]